MAFPLLNKWASPQDCLLCGAPAFRPVCPSCDACLPRAAGEPPPPGLDGALALFEYRFPLDRLVRRFKAGGDFAAGRWLAEALAARVAGEPPVDRVVAPPTPRERLARRGLNPALHLARRVARARGLPCGVASLERVHDTPPQRGLDRAARRANIRGAFRCAGRVDGLRLALVDDVVTTGATAEEIARVLREAGAASVVLWAVARTPAPAEG